MIRKRVEQLPLVDDLLLDEKIPKSDRFQLQARHRLSPCVPSDAAYLYTPSLTLSR